MDDLFGYVPDHGEPAPRPYRADGLGLVPWDGCDIKSEAWRAYCEAAGYVRGPHVKTARNMLDGIERHRGKDGRAYLERVIVLVKKDLAGDLHPRENIGIMIGNIMSDIRADAARKAIQARTTRRR